MANALISGDYLHGPLYRERGTCLPIPKSFVAAVTFFLLTGAYALAEPASAQTVEPPNRSAGPIATIDIATPTPRLIYGDMSTAQSIVILSPSPATRLRMTDSLYHIKGVADGVPMTNSTWLSYYFFQNVVPVTTGNSYLLDNATNLVVATINHALLGSALLTLHDDPAADLNQCSQVERGVGLAIAEERTWTVSAPTTVSDTISNHVETADSYVWCNRLSGSCCLYPYYNEDAFRVAWSTRGISDVRGNRQAYRLGLAPHVEMGNGGNGCDFFESNPTYNWAICNWQVKPYLGQLYSRCLNDWEQVGMFYPSSNFVNGQAEPNIGKALQAIAAFTAGYSWSWPIQIVAYWGADDPSHWQWHDNALPDCMGLYFVEWPGAGGVGRSTSEGVWFDVQWEYYGTSYNKFRGGHWVRQDLWVYPGPSGAGLAAMVDSHDWWLEQDVAIYFVHT